jgi:hypothetical protein
MIHGTFAQNAKWCQPTSKLSQNLIDGLRPDEVFVEPFPWSGRNSFVAREQAARELQTHFTSMAQKYPEAIAHSHGGNVFLRSLHLYQPENLAAAVCLSTPFLAVTERQTGERFELLAWAAIVAILLSNVLTRPFKSMLNLLAYVLPVEVVVLVGAFLSLCFIAFYGFWIVGLIHSYSNRITKRIVDCSILLSATTHIRVLIIRPTADEASFLLASLTMANWVLSRIWRIWNYLRDRGSHLRAMVNGLLFIASLAVAIWAAVVYNIPVLESALRIVGYLIWCLTVPLAVGMTVFALGFGFDVFWAALTLQLSAEATPPKGLWSVYTLRSPAIFKGDLRHGDPYDSDEAISEVLTWFKRSSA